MCGERHTVLIVSDLQGFAQSEAGNADFQSIVAHMLSLDSQILSVQSQQPLRDSLSVSHTLAWMAQSISNGFSLCGSPEQAAVQLCRRILALALYHQARDADQAERERNAVLILLHILHPILASAFGMGKGLVQALPLLGEGAQIRESPLEEARKGPVAMREEIQAMGSQRDDLSKASTGNLGGQGMQDEVLQHPYSSAWKDSQLWLFLLGNTLIRALDLAGLPPFENPEAPWPPAR